MKVANFQNSSIEMDETNEAGDKAYLFAFILGNGMQLNATDKLMSVKGTLDVQSYMQMIVQSLDIPTQKLDCLWWSKIQASPGVKLQWHCFALQL